jgi:hypothetical protein
VSVVDLYGREGCCLCDDARVQLVALSRELDFELIEHDIDRDDELQRRYFERIPVVVLDGEEISDYFVDVELLRARTSSRPHHLESGQ